MHDAGSPRSELDDLVPARVTDEQRAARVDRERGRADETRGTGDDRDRSVGSDAQHATVARVSHIEDVIPPERETARQRKSIDDRMDRSARIDPSNAILVC